MKHTLASALLAILSIPGLAADPTEQGEGYAELLRRADGRYAEKSFELARADFERALGKAQDESEKRYASLRLGDAAWRAAASSQNPDATDLERARKRLEDLVAGEVPIEERDLVWAEAHASLGDFLWDRRGSADWGGGWQHYQLALDWWAGASDVERARRRTLDIIFTAANPEWSRDSWSNGSYGNYVPRERLEDAVKIALAPSDVARASYLLAIHFQNQGQDRRMIDRARALLQGVLELGKEGEWYDDALFQLGQSHENYGVATRNEKGEWQWKSDFVRAVEIYRRLIAEHEKGESRWHDAALDRIRTITGPTVEAHVDRFFLPDSEIRYFLSWRNAKRVDLGLYAVDLVRDVPASAAQTNEWLARIDLTRLEAAQRWSHDTQDRSDHAPGQATLVLEERLAPGAYVLEARAEGKSSRALVLVSDATLTVKHTGTQLLAWLTEVREGAPIPEAEVFLWERWHDGKDWRSRASRGRTTSDGTALFPAVAGTNRSDFFVAARAGARQAFAQSWSQGPQSPAQGWRFYAFTDRPVYRPDDLVQYEFFARVRGHEAYSTPDRTRVSWEIVDPLGAVVGKGDAELNRFGAAWSSFATKSSMPLGEYQIRFHEPASGGRGQATLFRLEEYKRPEFEVTVEPATNADGSTRLFLVGDRVDVAIEAAYYFGGPVANASVEVFVHQRPHWRGPEREREFPWLYADAQWGQDWWGGPGEQVLHQVVRTDAEGKALVGFDTPLDANQDFEYSIQARVTDASRREIVGSGGIVVTQRAHTLDVEVAHRIHRPGSEVEATFRAADANGEPVLAVGRVELLRERWTEVWLDPTGRKVFGEELSRLKRGEPLWPPRVETLFVGWRLESRGYQSEVVATTTLRTAADGKASWLVTVAREGTYRVKWAGPDARGNEVVGEASFFVADEGSRELGYLPGGVEILVDRDTLAVGETAAVLISTPASGRHVLFSVENEDLLAFHVLKLDGTVKLVELPITEAHVPNVHLGAVMVEDGRAWTDDEELVVPPKKQFLDVSLAFDAEAYLPGGEGSLHVLVTDHLGRPVEVELALAVIDDSLGYLQGDYAGDPRRFFYGDRREHRVILGGSFQHMTYGRLVKDQKGDVIDERELRNARNEEQGVYYGFDQDDEFKLGISAGRRLESLEKSAMRGRFDAVSESAQPRGAYRGAGDSVPASQAGALAAGLGGEVEVRVRSDFRETALWLPGLTTDTEGSARVSVRFPDSTTRFKATARAIDGGTRVGMATTSAKTRQPLIARLQAPRFFVVGDEVTLSGVFNDNTERSMEVRATLEATGLQVLGAMVDGRLVPEHSALTIPANGEARLDWRVRVVQTGSAILKLAARGADLGDAVEQRIPVFPHGISVLIARSGKFSSSEIALALDLPGARKSGTTSLEVQVTPSIAVTMLDALPYLVDYPYGCTEQTLSRFLPSAIVARTLAEFGLSAEDAMTRAFGGIEADFAAQTHPKGKLALDRLQEMTAQGLERLYDFQHSDGGWAWWKDGDSDPFMTAYVVWGLALGRGAGMDVRAGVLENGARFLALEIVEAEERPDLAAWMLHALAEHGVERLAEEQRGFAAKAFENLWNRREKLNAYSRALLTLAAVRMRHLDRARVLADNLANGVQLDEAPDRSILSGGGSGEPFVMATAHWGEDGIFRRWSEGGVEATAFVLRALLAVDPKHRLVEPTMNWLVKNRRGAQWSNTRDTAIVVLALNDYLKLSGELGSDVEFEVLVNGRSIATTKLVKQELLRAPSRFDIDTALLKDGANDVRIVKKAGGALYFAAYARFFSQEEPIPARGNELFVRREYYKLVGHPTLLRGHVYERVPLLDGDTIQSGERVEVVLTLEAKNELEYLLVEDLKPAGFEAVQVKSGESLVARELEKGEIEARYGEANGEARRRGSARDVRPTLVHAEGYTNRSERVHQELRDRQVALFLSHVAQGTWEVRYDLRAEVPGSFHALPLVGHAMYVPEIRANGEELRVTVLDPAP